MRRQPSREGSHTVAIFFLTLNLPLIGERTRRIPCSASKEIPFGRRAFPSDHLQRLAITTTCTGGRLGPRCGKCYLSGQINAETESPHIVEQH